MLHRSVSWQVHYWLASGTLGARSEGDCDAALHVVSVINSTFVGLSVVCAVVFGLVYYPIANRLSRGVASPYPKAPVGKRVGAALIDSMVVIMTGWAFYIQSQSLVYPFACAAYVLLRDSASGRSFGKFCCSLVVIDLYTGQLCGRSGSAKRNALFLLPGANISAVVLEAATPRR